MLDGRDPCAAFQAQSMRTRLSPFMRPGRGHERRLAEFASTGHATVNNKVIRCTYSRDGCDSRAILMKQSRLIREQPTGSILHFARVSFRKIRPENRCLSQNQTRKSVRPAGLSSGSY